MPTQYPQTMNLVIFVLKPLSQASNKHEVKIVFETTNH